MLEAQNLSIIFNASFKAVDNVNLNIECGKVTTLCGPNGAGKSTLLAALAGDLVPQSGAALLDKKPLKEFSPERLARRRVVLEQNPSLSASFSVKKLASLSIGIEVSPTQMEKIVFDSLKDVGLTDRAMDRADQLSGGQRHRAHLARVLGQLAATDDNQECFLLLDEPTASLDIIHQIAVMKVARQAASNGVGVLVVLHDLNLAAAFSDRIALMQDGRLVIDGTPSEVFTAERLSNVYQTQIEVDIDASNNLRITPVFEKYNS